MALPYFLPNSRKCIEAVAGVQFPVGAFTDYMKRKGKAEWIGKVAKERIERLFHFAEKYAKNRPELSKRYITMALKISKKYNVTISSELKKKFCKKCHVLFIPGKTVVVRKIRGLNMMLYICRECKAQIKRRAKG